MNGNRECAVGPCHKPRLDGQSYCAGHGPASNYRASVAQDRQTRIVCPHCNTRGSVHTKPVKVKRGISGGKATGAVVTLGWSLLATGLSRKVKVTEAKCDNCNVTWLI